MCVSVNARAQAFQSTIGAQVCLQHQHRVTTCTLARFASPLSSAKHEVCARTSSAAATASSMTRPEGSAMPHRSSKFTKLVKVPSLALLGHVGGDASSSAAISCMVRAVGVGSELGPGRCGGKRLPMCMHFQRTVPLPIDPWLPKVACCRGEAAKGNKARSLARACSASFSANFPPCPWTGACMHTQKHTQQTHGRAQEYAHTAHQLWAHLHREMRKRCGHQQAVSLLQLGHRGCAQLGQGRQVVVNVSGGEGACAQQQVVKGSICAPHSIASPWVHAVHVHLSPTGVQTPPPVTW